MQVITDNLREHDESERDWNMYIEYARLYLSEGLSLYKAHARMFPDPEAHNHVKRENMYRISKSRDWKGRLRANQESALIRHEDEILKHEVKNLKGVKAIADIYDLILNAADRYFSQNFTEADILEMFEKEGKKDPVKFFQTIKKFVKDRQEIDKVAAEGNKSEAMAKLADRFNQTIKNQNDAKALAKDNARNFKESIKVKTIEVDAEVVDDESE